MAVWDGIDPTEMKRLRDLAEARRPGFTPFVGAKRLLLPDIEDLQGSSWEPYVVSHVQFPLRALAELCRPAAGYNGDSTSLRGFLYFMGNPTEIPWEPARRIQIERIFFPLAELAHPNGDIVSPYLILRENRRLSWNVLSLDGVRLGHGDGILCDSDRSGLVPDR